MSKPVCVLPTKAYLVNYDPNGTDLYLVEMTVLSAATDAMYWANYHVRPERFLYASSPEIPLPTCKVLLDASISWTLSEALTQLQVNHGSAVEACLFDIGRVSDTLVAAAKELTTLKANMKKIANRRLPELSALIAGSSEPDIIKVAALFIKDGKILTARNKDRQLFYAVGGKLEPGETEQECLTREVAEEIDCKVISSTYYKTFEGMNFDNTKTLRMPCYLAQLDGEPKSSNEIAELLWVSAESYQAGDKERLANMLSNYILPSLIQDKLL